MSESVQRAQFRANMVMIRHSVDSCDSQDAEFFYRELMREVKKLAGKFRTGNQFVIAEQSRNNVISATEPTGS